MTLYPLSCRQPGRAVAKGGMATMERYLANPELKDAMTQAGVTAWPTVLIGLAT